MHASSVLAILEKQALTYEEIDLCIEFFRKNHTINNVDSFKRFYALVNGMVNESQILRLISVIESFLLDDCISNNDKASLVNNKTCFCLMINNKYEALDSAFKFLEYKCDNMDEIYLNANYFFNVYFEEGLYNEAIRVSKDILNNPYFDNYNIFLKFCIYGNLFLAYAKILDYSNYKYYEEIARDCIEKMQIDVYTQYYNITKLSAEALLYHSNKDKIDFNELIIKYKSLLNEYDNRSSTIFDTVDTHLDIIDKMINQNLLADAEDICNLLLTKTNSSRYNLGVYKCLKKIYEATNSPKYMQLLINYVNCIEMLDSKEAEFYRSYIMRFATLYEISSNYYELLNDYEHDALTNCYSRGAFDSLLEKNTYVDGSLLFFDINDFKTVNDTYGHATGDEFLKFFSKNLLNVFSPIAECYRIGGDEFVAIVHTIDKKVIKKYIQDFDTALRKNNFFDDGNYFGFSVGISRFTSSLSLEMVLKQADEAMYECKNGDKEIFYKFYKQ